MGGFVGWIHEVALAWGTPGLFVVAFLDSSFLPLPELNDVLLVWMVTRNKPLMLLYASSVAAGSLAGCLVLYSIGRRGGERLVKGRFGAERVERATATLRRYGTVAVLTLCLLPPPAPFKLFVLLAGVGGISVGRFSLAIVIGRAIRFFGLAFLALRYGDDALAFVEAHGRQVSLTLAALVAAGLAAYVLWTRAQRSGKVDKLGGTP
jgi:membrane protein YqaA with SNARE-associated domain